MLNTFQQFMQLNIFVETVWYIFEILRDGIEISYLCNIFTATIDQFNASFLNKCIDFFKTNDWPQTSFSKYEVNIRAN